VTFGAPEQWPKSVVAYTVVTKKIDGDTQTVVNMSCVRGLRQTRACTITGLTGGETYRFDVTATNLCGFSTVAESSTVTLTEPAPAPAPAPDPVLSPGTFHYTASSVHAVSIGVLVERGVVRGCAPELFCPHDTVTRGQFATMLAKVMELPAQPAGSRGFVDIDGHPHAAGIRAVLAAELFGGVSATHFDSNGSIRRGQVASVLAGAAGLSPVAHTQFLDVAGSVHAGAIGGVVKAGLARGTSDTTFAPSAHLSRAQAATLMVSLIEFREQ